MTLLVYAAVAAWLVAWAIGAVGVLRRADLGVGGKALWLVLLLVLPLAGLLVWYLWQAANPDRSGSQR
jgi:hypothetical protein